MKLVVLLSAAALLAGCNRDSGNNSVADSRPLTPIAAPNGGDWRQQVAQTRAGGMLMGNPDAPVKVVEYSSMTCPHCAHFAQDGAPKLIASYVKSGQVSFELRNFVRDGLDISMALVARCGGASPRYFALTDALFQQQVAIMQRLQAVPAPQQKQIGALPAAQQFRRVAELAGLPAIAAQQGLPSAQTNQCLANSAEANKLVQMNSEAVNNYQLSGTPTFLINNRVVDMPDVAEDKVWDTLEQRIRDALA